MTTCKKAFILLTQMKHQNTKLKILRIISRMNVGGPSKHVVNLAEGLNKYNCETLLISGQPGESEGEMFELTRHKNFLFKKIDFLRRPISPFNDLISFIKLVKEIINFSPDIVHTHTTKAGILGRAAALICGVPKIYHTYHGHVFKGYFSKFQSCLVIAIERFFSTFTTKVIALTPDLASELRDILRINKNKIAVIPLGLDLNNFLSMPRKANIWRKSVGLKKNDFVIGIVARLVPIKDHKKLINSMKSLCTKFPDLYLAIIGGGELEEELKIQTNKLGLSNNIHFYGFSKELEKIYSDIDLLVLCSKNEGTPVVIIEALASGCPVAAVDVGGVREVLGNGERGRLLPSEQNQFTQALSEAVSDIKEGKFKEYPTEQTRKQISEFYSVEKLSENVFDLYGG